MFHKIKVCICVFILCFVNTLALAQEIKRFAPRIDYTFKLGNRRDISRLGILAPIQETKSGLLFSNIFGLYDSRDNVELNLGFGYRELIKDNIVGISAFFDKRKSNTGNIFSQLTFGLEYFRRYFEFRFNSYVPIGKKSKLSEASRTLMPRNYLLVNQPGFNTEKALWGLDVEVGGSLPFLERLSGHIAYYHFNDEDIKAINGVRFRSSLKLSDYVSLEGEIARDRLRDINYLVGARVHIDIGGKTKRLTPLEQKMTQMVIRDIDIITDEVKNSFEADNSKALSYKADWDETGKFVDVSSEEAKDIKLEIDENGNIKDVDFKGRKPKGYILEEAYKRAKRLRDSSHPRRGATSSSYSDIDLILDNLAISRSNALKVLGLGEGASLRDIKKAYRRLTLIHHPDRGGDADNFNCLQDAYNIALALNENDYTKLVNIVGKSSYKKNYAFVPEGFNQNFVEPTISQEVVNPIKAITLTPEPISSSSISGLGMSGVYDRIEFTDSKTARLVGATKSIAIEPHYIKGIPQNLTKSQLTRFIKNSRVNVSPLLDKHTNQVNGYSIDVVGRIRGGMKNFGQGNYMSSQRFSSVRSQDSRPRINLRGSLGSNPNGSIDISYHAPTPTRFTHMGNTGNAPTFNTPNHFSSSSGGQHVNYARFSELREFHSATPHEIRPSGAYHSQSSQTKQKSYSYTPGYYRNEMSLPYGYSNVPKRITSAITMFAGSDILKKVSIQPDKFSTSTPISLFERRLEFLKKLEGLKRSIEDNRKYIQEQKEVIRKKGFYSFSYLYSRPTYLRKPLLNDEQRLLVLGDGDIAGEREDKLKSIIEAIWDNQARVNRVWDAKRAYEHIYTYRDVIFAKNHENAASLVRDKIKSRHGDLWNKDMTKALNDFREDLKSRSDHILFLEADFERRVDSYVTFKKSFDTFYPTWMSYEARQKQRKRFEDSDKEIQKLRKEILALRQEKTRKYRAPIEKKYTDGLNSTYEKAKALAYKEKQERKSIYFGRELYDAVEKLLRQARESSVSFEEEVHKAYPLWDEDRDLSLYDVYSKRYSQVPWSKTVFEIATRKTSHDTEIMDFQKSLDRHLMVLKHRDIHDRLTWFNKDAKDKKISPDEYLAQQRISLETNIKYYERARDIIGEKVTSPDNIIGSTLVFFTRNTLPMTDYVYSWKEPIKVRFQQTSGMVQGFGDSLLKGFGSLIVNTSHAVTAPFLNFISTSSGLGAGGGVNNSSSTSSESPYSKEAFGKVATKSANTFYKNFTDTVSWVWGYFSGSNKKDSGGLKADLSGATGMPDPDDEHRHDSTENFSRTLTKQDLGIEGHLEEFSGRFSVNNDLAVIRVENIRGRIDNPLKIVNNAVRLARSHGATTLRIEGTLANDELYSVLARRYRLTTHGSSDVINITIR